MYRVPIINQSPSRSRFLLIYLSFAFCLPNEHSVQFVCKLEDLLHLRLSFKPKSRVALLLVFAGGERGIRHIAGPALFSGEIWSL